MISGNYKLQHNIILIKQIKFLITTSPKIYLKKILWLWYIIWYCIVLIIKSSFKIKVKNIYRHFSFILSHIVISFKYLLNLQGVIEKKSYNIIFEKQQW